MQGGKHEADGEAKTQKTRQSQALPAVCSINPETTGLSTQDLRATVLHNWLLKPYHRVGGSKNIPIL